MPRLLAFAAAVAVAGLAFSMAVLGGALSTTASSAALASLAEAAESCAISGSVPGLSAEQAADAGVVVSVAMADSAENELAARIALMTAWTESHLRNLGPLKGNAVSLGIFQQRASQGWGTPAEELDPAQATAMFVRRLVSASGWQRTAPWVAAQSVQRSAFSDASNYRANWGVAGQLLASVLKDGNAAGGCGQGPGGGVLGPGGAHGLPAGYVIPAGTPPAHAGAVSFAMAQLGKPYVWGAAGPGAYDCSGLTQSAWAASGVHLLHYTVDQWHEGQSVIPTAATPGDLVLIPGSDPPGPGLPGHVGIYLGDGLVLSAIDTQIGVAVQTWQVFVSGGLDGVVDPAPGR
jgi:cell wall-associated NlpC family hydrolase